MKVKHAVLLTGLAGFLACSLPGQSVDKPKETQPGERRSGPAQVSQKAQAQTRTNAVPKSDYPIVGYLETRGRTIIVKSGPKGPLYSVKTTEGKSLFENLSADQLRAQAPELHDFLKTAVAGNGTKSGVKADASLRMGKR